MLILGLCYGATLSTLQPQQSDLEIMCLFRGNFHVRGGTSFPQAHISPLTCLSALKFQLATEKDGKRSYCKVITSWNRPA